MWATEPRPMRSRVPKQPVIFSHGNARALCDSPRNMPDELVRAVANNGGMVGVTFFSPILRRDRRPSIDDWFDHVGT